MKNIITKMYPTLTLADPEIQLLALFDQTHIMYIDVNV